MAKKKWWNKSNPGDPFQKLQLFIPLGMFKKIKEVSAKKQMPASRVIAWALYNAMTKLDNPFEVNVPVPTYREHVPDSHLDQAAKLFRFLAGFPAGLPLDSLLMFTEEIGIRPEDLGRAFFQLKTDVLS